MSAGAPRQVVIGLDVGTTGVKAAAFGLDGPWRRLALREYPLLEPAPGQAVQDPGAITAAAQDALAECVAAAGAARVQAISVSAAMHGLMALDAEHRPITPLIAWADARADPEARELRRDGRARGLHRRTGAPVHPMTPLTKLLWFARHEPETMAAARWWVGLKEYLLLWLTGTLATELSSASGTGLLDLETRAWSPVALELCGLDAGRLPPILPTTATLALDAAVARRVGLPAGTTVVAGAGDGPLGNLGTGAIAPGVAGLSIGTSGAVRMAVGEPRVDDACTLFCYALTDTTWVIGGAASTGGAVVRWAGRALAPDLAGADGDGPADAAVLELAATAPPGCDGLVMLPHLLPERAPLWDPDLPAAYLGLRRGHTRAHLLRAAVEGVGLHMRLILDRLDAVAPVRSVRATGGVFRSELWREVIAATLARPVELVAGAEGTALGAAALGLLALGRAPDLEAALRAVSGGAGATAQTVDPDPAAVAAYEELRASVPALMHELAAAGSLLSAGGGAAATGGMGISGSSTG